ncbi:DUF3658 domain-containing protein [Pantoea stewartii]|uniref:DUF3658 domain-containing protein n=1 Tax=Pantoea stewartii TaxID=66269 RepID=UPI00249E5F6C|nr:DUF3658 domain-containing protein [Pantoea stewartii]
MEGHLFLDKSLYLFASVFLKEKIPAPFFYIYEDFGFGKLTEESNYEEGNAYLTFPVSQGCATRKRNLEEKINRYISEVSDVVLWTSSLHLNQECLMPVVLLILETRRVKVIDLAKSRRERASESTHDYYYSLYRHSHFLAKAEKLKVRSRQKELESQGGSLRIRYQGSLVNVKYEYFDNTVLECISDTPKNAMKIMVEAIVRLYGEGYMLPGDYLIIHRLYFLVNSGKLKICFDKLSAHRWSSMAFMRIY